MMVQAFPGRNGGPTGGGRTATRAPGYLAAASAVKVPTRSPFGNLSIPETADAASPIAGPISEPEKTRSGRWPRRTYGIAVACLFAVGAIVAAYTLNHAPARPPLHIFTNPKTWSSVDIDMALSRDGRIVATGNPEGNISLWDVAKGVIIRTLSDPAHSNGDLDRLAFSPSGEFLASTDGTDSVYLWDVPSHRIVAILTDKLFGGASVDAVTLSPSGRLLAASDDDGRTYLWDIASRRVLDTSADPRSGGVGALAFSPDGRVLATGDSNGHTYLRDVANMQEMSEIPGPTANKANATCPGTQALAFSPSGKELAIGNANGSTYLWNLALKKLDASFANARPNTSIVCRACPGNLAA